MLQRVSPGFVTERAVTMQVLLPQTRYANAAAMIAFYRRLRDEVRALPGVTASAVATTLPMTGSDIGMGFDVDGRPADPNRRTSAAFFGVSPDYFSTMGIPLVRGPRLYRARRRAGAGVIVISETMAAKYWPGEDPIGKRLTISYNKTGPREIVGIAGDVKQARPDRRAAPQMYTPFVQAPWPFLAAVVRTTAAPEATAGVAAAGAGAARSRAGRRRNPDARSVCARGRSRRRASRRCSSAASPALALLLAGFGLYGVMAYSVAQRRREIGIRMALGAQAADVRSLVVGQALRMGAAGLAIGLVGALLVTRVLDSLLFGVTAARSADVRRRVGGARSPSCSSPRISRRAAPRASIRWSHSERSNHADFLTERREVVSRTASAAPTCCAA